MNELLLRVFNSLERENIRYCLMRDCDNLDHLADCSDIDLLVQESQLVQLRGLLERLGFVCLPNRGYAPNHFFVAYDEESDRWLKLDVATEVAYGSPSHALRTSLATNCLSNRRSREFTFIPSPEDELIALLLHCVLDKNDFRAARSRRLQALCHEVTDDGYLSALLAEYWPPTVTWPKLAAQIAGGNWTVLLAERAVVGARLASRDKFRTLGRRVRDWVLRVLDRGLAILQRRGLTVAFLGPDGAGKTTLAVEIQKSFYFPVRSLYMASYKGNAARSDRVSVPVLGLVRGLLRQWWRYLTALYHQARGRLVVFDRYSYDAVLSLGQSLDWLKWGHCWLMAHACPAPDLVLVLDAPGEILYARKGEQSTALLEEERLGYLELQPRLSQMVVVDASGEADQVRRKVTALIWRGYASRLNGAKSINASVGE